MQLSHLHFQHVPVIQHVCEQPQEQDQIRNIIKGDRIWDKLNRWCLKQRILSRGHPLTRWCLKSTTAVNYEISRHLESHRYMIHPFSSFRLPFKSLPLTVCTSETHRCTTHPDSADSDCLLKAFFSIVCIY